MIRREHWRPTKFVKQGDEFRASRDAAMVRVGSRLMADALARAYPPLLARFARGALLDLGCGAVPLLEMYEPHTSSVTCVDWAHCRHATDHLDLVCDLDGALPFEALSFDTVLLSDVLEHIRRPEHLWEQVVRVLRPGGRIIVGVPFLYPIHEDPYDFHRFTRFKLEDMCRGAGLVVAHLEPYGGAPEVLFDIAGKLLPRTSLVTKMFCSLGAWSCRTRLGRRLSRRTAERFPLGYTLVAAKDE